MRGQELANEPSDFARGAGVEILAQRHEAVPVGAGDPDDQLAVLQALFLGLLLVRHGSDLHERGIAFAMHIVCIYIFRHLAMARHPPWQRTAIGVPCPKAAKDPDPCRSPAAPITTAAPETPNISPEPSRSNM